MGKCQSRDSARDFEDKMPTAEVAEVADECITKLAMKNLPAGTEDLAESKQIDLFSKAVVGQLVSEQLSVADRQEKAEQAEDAEIKVQALSVIKMVLDHQLAKMAENQSHLKSDAAVPEDGIALEFHQGSVVIKRRPVGIRFDMRKTPVEVCKVDGLGAELGVQLGWTIKAMDGEPADPDFQIFYSKFLMRLNSLPGKFVMPLLFKCQDNTFKTIVVDKGPLGLSLNKELPTSVHSVKGLSWQLGIKEGWVLEKYCDIPVSSHPDFNTFFEAFNIEVGKLQDDLADGQKAEAQQVTTEKDSGPKCKGSGITNLMGGTRGFSFMKSSGKYCSTETAAKAVMAGA